MKLLQRLGEALLEPSQLQHFLRKADTLLRRSLRTPHLTRHQQQFPPHAIAICVFAHLSNFSLEAVYDACTPDMLNHDIMSSNPVKHFDDVQRVWKHGWQPITSQLNLLEQHDQGDAHQGLFANYYVFLVPSLFFSKRLASLLLTKVEENGGKGRVVSNGEKGFNEVADELKTTRLKPSNVVLCTDITVLKRLSHLLNIPCLPHKWLTDSIRDNRIKTIEAYFQNRPKQLTTSPVTPATPAKRRNPDDDDNDHSSYIHTVSTKKMKKDSTAVLDPTNQTSVSLRRQLFETPTKAHNFSDVRADRQISSPRKIKWACEVRTSFNDSPFPMNDKICELLGVVQESYAIKKDHFRAIGYQKAIGKIRSLDYELLTGDDAKKAGSENTIGVKIERKIAEIIKTGRLRQAEAVLENSDNNTVKAFCDIWGVGPVKAMHLVAQGIKSIEHLREELKKRPHLLDRNQKIGLKLYEDLLHRIPRDEVADLEMYARKVVKSIDPTLDITVAGSYLRGKKSCGDVDIMLHGKTENVRKAFPKVSSAMKKSGILTDDLVVGPDKYFGIFKFPGRRHGRIDLFAVPEEEFPYALLTYTGSAIFNRSMRAKARALGYSLSHKGLQRVCRTKHSKARLEPSIVVKDEKEIFFLLDIPYVPPSARSISGSKLRPLEQSDTCRGSCVFLAGADEHQISVDAAAKMATAVYKYR